jgi:uncharacterized protein (DUF1015 family)
MPEVKPFEGIRYAAADQLKDLVCPPYDVIGPAEQARLYERHSHNAIRLELPAPEEPDEPKALRYERADQLFRRWLEYGVLARDENPAFYVYRQDFVAPGGQRRQVTGVMGALRLEDFGRDSGVLPHERTMRGPIEDRLTLLRACPVNVSPIYVIYRGGGRVMPFMDSLENRPTNGRLSDEHDNLHRLWIIRAPAEIEMLSSAMSEGPIVIADGHHRYETALAFAREQGAPGPHEAVMAFCVDADAGDLEVLPYHRAFNTGVSPRDLDTALTKNFNAQTYEPGRGSEALESSPSDHPLLFVLADREILVEVTDDEVRGVVGDRAAAWRGLDIVALHEVVFAQAFEHAPNDLLFSHDAQEIVELVSSGERTGGVLLKPLKAPEVIEVARSGERMPQKASYFWPKAITGLVFRSLDKSNT